MRLVAPDALVRMAVSEAELGVVRLTRHLEQHSGRYFFGEWTDAELAEHNELARIAYDRIRYLGHLADPESQLLFETPAADRF